MKTSSLVATLVGMVLLILPVTSARADIAILNPIQDNSISQGFPDNSNAQGNLFSGLTVHGGVLRALMLFDIADNVPAGATIDSVTLDLTLIRDNTSSNATFALHALSNPWGQGTSFHAGGQGSPATPGDATWNDSFFDSTPWNTPGGDFAVDPSGTATIGAAAGVYTFASQPGMVADVQNWLDSPDGNFGWILKDANEGSGVSAQEFGSMTSSQMPVLTVTFTPPVSGPPAWLAATNGNWSDGTKWSTGTPPNGAGQTAVLNQTTTAVVAVTLDEPIVLGTLQLGSSGGDNLGYTLSGSGGNTLEFDNSGSGATIAVSNGNHVISAPVVLDENLTVSGSGTLTFDAASSIASDSASLIMNGDGGTLILSGTNTYPGGTIVTAGTLVLTSPDAIASGTTLIVGDGATSLFGPSAPAAAPIAGLSAAITPVPEPGLLALAVAGLAVILGGWWRRKAGRFIHESRRRSKGHSER